MRIVRALLCLLALTALAAPMAAAPAAHAATSPATTSLQLNLSGLGLLPRSGVDGSYGPATTAAVKNFQNLRCLDVDGSAGAITTAELKNLVVAVQKKVGASADGVYGAGTMTKVKAWQSAKKIAPKGIADAATLKAMGIARSVACGGPVVGNPATASSTVACFPGTIDLGVRTDAYVNGKKISMRLCRIVGLKSTGGESNPKSKYYIKGANGDIMVSSRVSGAFQGLWLRAKRSGVKLSAASAYRSNAHQTDLYNASKKDGSAARPGWSNHQGGNAVDFATGGVFKRGAKCSTRSTTTSAMYYYLRRNAPKHGIGQLSTEAWHWQPVALDTASTCV